MNELSAIDYPHDVQALYFSFNGLPSGTQIPNTASAVSFAELKVCDLEA